MERVPPKPRPDGNNLRPSAPDCVNPLIQRPMDERTQQRVLATSHCMKTPMERRNLHWSMRTDWDLSETYITKKNDT